MMNVSYSLDVSRLAIKSVGYARGGLAHAYNRSSVQTEEGSQRRALRYQDVDEKGEVIEHAS
jgi:hypothetical protein